MYHDRFIMLFFNIDKTENTHLYRLVAVAIIVQFSYLALNLFSLTPYFFINNKMIK
jgi:hypothetical protein